MATQATRPGDNPADAVRNYVDAFNSGDLEAMAACFAVTGCILDGLAPHLWHGASAAENWYRDLLAAAGHEGASDYRVALGEPRHNVVSGESAYFVAPATMSFRLRGREVTQAGAAFTVALRRIAGRWHIAAWAWAKGDPAGS